MASTINTAAAKEIATPARNVRAFGKNLGDKANALCTNMGHHSLS